MILKLGFLSTLLFVVSSSFGQNPGTYSQSVRRDDVTIGQGLKGTKGLLTLGTDSIVFVASNSHKRPINFRLAYSEVIKVKRYKGIVLPNRIGIKTRDMRTYRLYTYKRRNILKILDSKTARNSIS